MSNIIITPPKPGFSRLGRLMSHFRPLPALNLNGLSLYPEQLPKAIRDSTMAIHCFSLLGSLDWGHFSEHNLLRNHGDHNTPYAALATAYLIKLSTNTKVL